MRISSSALVVVLCGCDSVFGLAPTHGPYLDGPIDAPFTCPPPGTPPMFSRSFQQFLLQPCVDYTASMVSGTALASCFEPKGVIEDGPLDGRMAPAPGLQDPNMTFSYPRLGPDGDVAVFEVYDSQAMKTTTQLFSHTPSGWTKSQDISPGFIVSSTTAPTRGSPRHLLALGPGGLHELVENAGGWTDHTTYTFAELGLAALGYELGWTPDGLRLVFTGELVGVTSTQLLYSDRPTIDDRFATAVAMPGIDFLPSGFMTEDCGRVYFPAFDSVFYAPRD